MSLRSRLLGKGSTTPLALIALALLVGLAETWGEDAPPADPMAELLKKLPDQPDLLINLKAYELPSTSDMVQLGKRITPALTNGLINNMEARVRYACATVLGATRDPRALQP